ncbi:hypothetical protein EJ110_NYTH05800 [Nymphaea thermarum]|nr:hypothetical protein EJ110_NYTH05800 [Nymphaea thermarum]
MHLLQGMSLCHVRRRHQWCLSNSSWRCSRLSFQEGAHDKAKQWIEEVERIFVLLKMPEEDKVNYGTYLLKEYITRYRHLEAYCPHFYTMDGAGAGKFVRCLREGLRSKVLTSRPRDLDEMVTMARCIEEDWARTQKDHQKKAGQHSQGGRTQVKRQHFAGITRPYERRDDRTFRRNQPTRSEVTQGSVATPTSQRCPTCSRLHPGKPCYREIGACLHCGRMGHFIKDCPLKKERELKKPEAETTKHHLIKTTIS